MIHLFILAFYFGHPGIATKLQAGRVVVTRETCLVTAPAIGSLHSFHRGQGNCFFLDSVDFGMCHSNSRSIIRYKVSCEVWSYKFTVVGSTPGMNDLNPYAT